MAEKRLRNTILTLLVVALVAALLFWVDMTGGRRMRDAIALFAIWSIAAVSLNLINGVTGILSLGHHGFMLVGGYITALLILPGDARERIASSARSQMNDVTLGIDLAAWFDAIGLSFLAGDAAFAVRVVLALFIGGLVAAFFGLIVGFPSLRLRGDYLAIVTFGFGEMIRRLASTSIVAPLTNGSLGFAGVPSSFGKSLWWTFALLLFTLFVMAKLKYSSYGRALQAIREDEIAAEAMGIDLSKHKVLAFAIAAFFAGVAGGLWVSWLGTARLDVFLFQLTFFFLVAIAVGGTGSITGTLIGVALVVFVRQYGDPLEERYSIATWMYVVSALLFFAGVAVVVYRSILRYRPKVPLAAYGLLLAAAVVAGIPWFAPELDFLQDTWRAFGMRAILLSSLLIVIMIFRPSGIFGRAEFSWAWLLRDQRDVPSDDERAQDAWLSNPALNKQAADKKLSEEA